MDVHEGHKILRAACELAVLHDRTGRAVREAIAAADRGDIDAAINLASGVAASESRCSDPHAILGCLMEQKGNARVAAQHFRVAVSRSPLSPMVLWYTARHEMCVGNTAVGLAMLQEATAGEPLDSYAAISLAWYLGLLAKPGEAEAVLKRLTHGGERLVCRELETMLLAMARPNELRLSDHASAAMGGCAGDLMEFCATADDYDDLCRTIAERLTAGRRPGTEGTLGRPCPHLVNPAVPGYVSRYGKRLVEMYAQAFWREILGPEIGGFLSRAFASQWAKRVKPRHRPPDMALIPKGTYNVADPARSGAALAIERPAFLMDRYPVTQQQWQEFVPTDAVPKGQENHPAVNVNFIQANLYARWKKKRLPTEAEWEAAAAGTGGARYPWGNEPDSSRANCAESRLQHTTPVTQFPRGASPHGVFDMIGNAQEWVQAQAGHRLLPPETQIVKGGGLALPMGKFTLSWRLAIPPLAKNPLVGFRCGRDL